MWIFFSWSHCPLNGFYRISLTVFLLLKERYFVLFSIALAMINTCNTGLLLGKCFQNKGKFILKKKTIHLFSKPLIHQPLLICTRGENQRNKKKRKGKSLLHIQNTSKEHLLLEIYALSKSNTPACSHNSNFFFNSAHFCLQ